MNQPRRLFLKNSTIVLGSMLINSDSRPLIAAEATEKKFPTVSIDTNFPGGNIMVDKIKGDQIDLYQDVRDTDDWFYWYFRVRGAAGRTLTFRFIKGNLLAAHGPAISLDNAKTWTWEGNKLINGATFTYSFPSDAEEVRFCLAIPYQEENLERFLDRYTDNKHLLVEPHCQTKHGRSTRRLRIGNLGANPRHRLLFTCRHHSCEMMASWVLEGLMETILSDTDDGRWFRENTEALVIPFMDKDGVEEGDQGKKPSSIRPQPRLSNQEHLPLGCRVAKTGAPLGRKVV